MPVEIVVGDLFASTARLLVVPCSVSGSMDGEARLRVTRMGAAVPAGPFDAGQVVPVPVHDRLLLFAMVAREQGELAERVSYVRSAAHQVGTHAGSPDATAAFPLLATGAGRVPVEDSVRAIVDGFNESAHPEARLQIYVRADEVAATVRDYLSWPSASVSTEPVWPQSGAVADLARRWPAGAQVAAGIVAAAALASPTVGEGGPPGQGPPRTIEEHLRVVRRRWSRRHLPRIDADAVVLALALDEAVGQTLLRDGVLHTLGAARRVAGLDPAWDALSREGRRLAENQPLVAAALGAPAEWSVRLPGPVRMISFAPGGRRLAALVGDDVYEAGPDHPPALTASLAAGGRSFAAGAVRSMGWGREGLLALCATGDGLEIVRVGSRDVLAKLPGATDGRLAGGLPVWVAGPAGVALWEGLRRPAPVVIDDADARVVAVDDAGTRGLLLRHGGAEVIAFPSLETVRHGSRGPSAPVALFDLDGDPAVAEVTEDGRLVIVRAGGPTIAEIPTGGAPPAALAAGGGGRCLAVAVGDQVHVWPVATTLSHAVAGYHPDAIDGADLLDTDRDALALAALIASRELRPPLAVGLFGEWGSGKTFVLDRIVGTLRELAAAEDEGFLDDIVTVQFNAWHYAETNLWASLVDQVLRKIAPPEIATLPEVAEADRLLSAAGQEVSRLERELLTADATIAAATDRLVRRRRTAWLTGGVVLLLVAAAAVTAALGRSAVLITVLGAAAAVVGYVTAAAGQIIGARDQARDISSAGRDGLAALSRFAGRADEEAARVAAARKADLLAQARAARDEQDRLRAQAARLRSQAGSDQMAAVLGQLSTVTEYRDQLSLVTRTRDLFDDLDTKFRNRKRVVIAIDDLDRCAAEKVVQVLEAVHLLFNFEMFVVVLAVDTRWLDQSLRIRYHQLLGGAGGAKPSDYLEKIIQIPMRLVPLDAALTRKMIAGLTGIEAPDTAIPPTAAAPAVDPPTVTFASPPPPAGSDGGPTPAGSDGGPTRAGSDGGPTRAGSHGGRARSGSDAGPEVTPMPEPGPPSPWSPPPRRHPAEPAAVAGSAPREPRRTLPAKLLSTTPAEAAAMAVVAPLVGATPRTVKRFVNTYRLLKARVDHPADFDDERDGIGDHEVVAFLLAVVTGRPEEAAPLLSALSIAAEGCLIEAVEDAEPAPAAIGRWLASQPRYANAPRYRFAAWGPEVARFSF